MALQGSTINMQSCRSLDSSCLALVLLSTLPKWQIVATMPTSSPLSSLSTSAVAALRAGEGGACARGHGGRERLRGREGWIGSEPPVQGVVFVVMLLEGLIPQR